MTTFLKGAAGALVLLLALFAGQWAWTSHATHRNDDRNLHALVSWGVGTNDVLNKLLTLPEMEAALLQRYPDLKPRLDAAKQDLAAKAKQ